MKISIQNFRSLLAAITATAAFAFPAMAADLSDQGKQFLAGYDKLHHALAADDLTSAQTAAKQLGDEGADVVKAKSLAEARVTFEKLSAKAKGMIAGQPGYYAAHCSMLKKDWVQTSTAIANPYAGKSMPTCGEIVK